MASQIQEFNYFVGGKWASGSAAETFELGNPATGEVVGRVPRAGKDDVGEAVKSHGRPLIEEESLRNTPLSVRGVCSIS